MQSQEVCRVRVTVTVTVNPDTTKVSLEFSSVVLDEERSLTAVTMIMGLRMTTRVAHEQRSRVHMSGVHGVLMGGAHGLLMKHHKHVPCGAHERRP